MDPRRQLLLELLQDALQAVDGRCATRAALGNAQRSSAPVWVIAVGKAAGSMALGAYDALSTAIERTLIITKDGHVPPDALTLTGVEIIESSHPVPDERSLRAGEHLLRWVDTCPHSVDLIFLVSGGASSLVEVLVAGCTLEDLRRLNDAGLTSGLGIEALNARRKAISLVKGGRLVSRLRGRRARALFISDVPGDDPAVIGSGLLGPAPDGPDNVERVIVASVEHAMTAAYESALRRGLSARKDHARFDGDAERLAVRFAHELRMQREQVAVWGGESVMHLPDSPGRGGRNQHLALATARLIAGHDDLLLLAAGTDGTDGPTADAGALVDGDTCARLTLAELDIDQCLKCADSGTALAASGDLVHTGPTGTNVGDLVIGLKMPKA